MYNVCYSWMFNISVLYKCGFTFQSDKKKQFYKCLLYENLNDRLYGLQLRGSTFLNGLNGVLLFLTAKDTLSTFP